jgi:hypothetical protein
MSIETSPEMPMETPTAMQTTHTAMQTVALADVPPLPWKNGGGTSRDLLAWPDAQGWKLRISVAEVANAGPFSAYPGVARWFAVAHGAGVVLHFADGCRRLNIESPPLCFDGAHAPGCTLIDGPTLDLNLMALQAAGRAAMTRAEPGVPWADAAPLRAVFSWHDAELRVDGAAAIALPAGTLAYTTQALGERWQLQARDLRAWWLAFNPGWR